MARIVTQAFDTEAFIRRLRAKGWKLIGEGFHGSARAKGRLVWKIQQRGRQGWGAYIEAVARGVLRGPHVPRVKLVVYLACGGIAALMERLVETVHQRHSGTPKADTIRAVVSRDTWWAKPWNAEKWGVADILRALKRQAPLSLFRFSRELHRWIATHRHGPDLHTGNMMYRANGVLVITDPVV